MAQTYKVSGVATSIRTEEGTTHVRYHATDVVSFNADVIVLRSGGWHTNTTKNRMMQASHQFGLGFSVWQKDFAWYVDYRGHTRDFTDGMVLRRS
jgi:hypothetical protein